MIWNLIIIPASSQGYFRSVTWSSSSQCLQHCIVLQQQQFNRFWVSANVCCPPWKWYWLLELRSQLWPMWYSPPHIPGWCARVAALLQMGQWGSGQTPYLVNHLCCEQAVTPALNVVWCVGLVWFAQELALVWYLCQWRAAPQAFRAHQHLVPSAALPGKIILDYHNDLILSRLVVFHARDHGWNDSLRLEACSSRLW